MKIEVLVKTRTKEDAVRKFDATHFAVSVKAIPHEGRANVSVIKVLAKYLGLAKSRLRIVSGETTKRKMIEIA